MARGSNPLLGEISRPPSRMGPRSSMTPGRSTGRRAQQPWGPGKPGQRTYTPGATGFTYSTVGQDIPAGQYGVDMSGLGDTADYQTWINAGRPLQGYGAFDSSSQLWAQHPTAQDEFAARDQNSGGFQVPGWWTGTPEEYMKQVSSGQLDTETIMSNDAQWAANEAVNRNMEGGASNLDATSTFLTGEYDKYRGVFDTSKQNAIATMQQAVQRFQDSPTSKALLTYSSPEYNAYSDKTVTDQRVAAARQIAKSQANTTAGAVRSAADRGIETGGMASQLEAQAGFQSAAERAGINARLSSEQEMFNEDARRRALTELGQRDRTEAELNSLTAKVEAGVPQPNPYAGAIAGLAGMAAELRAGKGEFAVDFTATNQLDEIDRLMQESDFTLQEIQTTLSEADVYWKGVYADAGTEKERVEARSMIDAITDIGSVALGILGLIPGKVRG